MKPTDPGLEYYVGRLKTRDHFGFARYGDGEFLAAMGIKGMNCDKHEYFPELGAALRHALERRASYIYAIGPKAARGETGAMVTVWLEEKGLQSIPWHSTEVWLKASLAGQLYPFVETIRERRLVYIGPMHLSAFAKRALGAWQFVTIPDRNCWLKAEELTKLARGAIEALGAEIILFSAGMTTNVIIDRLYDDYGKLVTMLDMGSVFDPYVGVYSRSYMRRRNDWRQLGRLNFEGAG